MALKQSDRNPGREPSGQGHGSGKPEPGFGIPNSAFENTDDGSGVVGGTRKDDPAAPRPGPAEGRDVAPRGRGRDEDDPWLGGG